ncbi:MULTISPECIES: hypothetical protein [unclassified Candidatus Paralachnospira]|uniref:hypothetical protein n=1 Tax=unclassified Candidatus Paralachnospira TaxID=3099471 RepID=UPI003F8E3F02
MAYADYEYYADNYLLGRVPAVPDIDFPYWERRAERLLDQHTFGRLLVDPGLITGEVKDCICELAELLYRADQAMGQEGSGLLSSYSNDGESGTFDLSQSPYTERGKRRKAGEIINRYLSRTGLLYKGLD